VDLNWTTYERGVDYELELVPGGVPPGKRFILRVLPGGPTFSRGDTIAIEPIYLQQPPRSLWHLFVDGTVTATAKGLEAGVTLLD
jgi:hypothetical protein